MQTLASISLLPPGTTTLPLGTTTLPPGTITQPTYLMGQPAPPPDPLPSEEFILWLNGALDVLSDTPPTPEQWERVRERIAEQVGQLVAKRMRDRASAGRVDTQAAQAKAQSAAVSAKLLTAQQAQQQQQRQMQANAALRSIVDYGVLTAPAPEAKPVRFGALKSWLSNG